MQMCPCCGSLGKLKKALAHQTKNKVWELGQIQCTNLDCGMMTPPNKTPKEALAIWEKRYV